MINPPEMRSPQHPAKNLRASDENKRSNRTKSVTEILGTVLAALIFSSVMLASVIGMTGGFDHAEAVLMTAEVDHDGR